MTKKIEELLIMKPIELTNWLNEEFKIELPDSLEDVMEEIFGDVQDEFDEEAEFDIKELKPNHYLANGMMRLDELANFFDVPDEKLEDEDVDTIAGLVVKELGRLAQLDDVVKYHEFTFTVKEIDGARITKLLIVREELQVEEVIAE